MNYLREINAFFDWLETNPLEASTQTLWFHLMAVANKSGWPEWFAVANPLLQAKVGVTENTLTKHRNYLVQKGRIEYKSQGKQQAGRYRLIPLTSNNEVNHEVKYEAKYAVNHEVKGSALFKLNETKQDSGEMSDIVNLNFRKAIRVIDTQFPARINSLQSQHLEYYISKGMEHDLVTKAVDITRLKKKDIGYLWGILQRCDERGIMTLAAFEATQPNQPLKPSTASYFEQKAREAELEEV
ncbi:DnaD domain protein [Paenibacillus sp. OV219]|uniref:DnaD domain protein n=1 Tax=Paenibacillus sp. OV219 TaxID=1884377 RepID=UPI0008D7B177|nr:DnaD domain protein [Paenibacillus sp. OV219]SEM80800.1 DnaD and phage-associated domain-containing protein [Paenibacillus sp. OV219]